MEIRTESGWGEVTAGHTFWNNACPAILVKQKVREAEVLQKLNSLLHYSGEEAKGGREVLPAEGASDDLTTVSRWPVTR